MDIPKPSAQMVELFSRVAPRDEGVVHKNMFGFPACFVNGNMFAGLHSDHLFVRLGEADRAKLLSKGGHTLEPIPGKPMKEYIIVPVAMHTNDSELRAWLARGLDFGRTLPPKEKKPKKK